MSALLNMAVSTGPSTDGCFISILKNDNTEDYLIPPHGVKINLGSQIYF